jgi:SAM-dependent methyltransferase
MTPGKDTLYESSAVYGMLFARRERDLPFYLGLADAAGPGARILDLGVGQGRVAIAQARAGHRVLGLDDAPAMLAAFVARVEGEAPEVRERLRWRLGCARTTRLGERFDLVECPFNGIAHQRTDAELASFFARSREHLAPGGRLAFDALIPDAERKAEARIDIPWFRHPERGTSCRATEIRRWDAAREILTIALTIRFMEEERADEELELALRLHHPDGWPDKLAAHGLTLERREDLGDVVALVARESSEIGPLNRAASPARPRS